MDFWVQALKEGDVSPVVLGQTFLFSSAKINSYTDGADILSQASLALLGEDLMQTGGEALTSYYQEGGAVLVYKIVYSMDRCTRKLWPPWGWSPASGRPASLDRDTLAAEVQAAQATRATQSVHR